MILVKLLSRDGKMFEEELASVKQMRKIWRAYEERNRPSNRAIFEAYAAAGKKYDSDEPYKVSLMADDLELILRWGRLVKRQPYQEKTVEIEHFDCLFENMSPEKQHFFEHLMMRDLHTMEKACRKLDCWRLYSEVCSILSRNC